MILCFVVAVGPPFGVWNIVKFQEESHPFSLGSSWGFLSALSILCPTLTWPAEILFYNPYWDFMNDGMKFSLTEGYEEFLLGAHNSTQCTWTKALPTSESFWTLYFSDYTWAFNQWKTTSSRVILGRLPVTGSPSGQLLVSKVTQWKTSDSRVMLKLKVSLDKLEAGESEPWSPEFLAKGWPEGSAAAEQNVLMQRWETTRLGKPLQA